MSIVIKRDGYGFVALQVSIEQAVILLTAVVVQLGVIIGKVGVILDAEVLVVLAFGLRHALAEDGGTEHQRRKVTLAAFHVVDANEGDIVEDGTFDIIEGIVSENVDPVI